MASLQYLGKFGGTGSPNPTGLDGLEVVNGPSGRTLTFTNNNGTTVTSGQISLLSGQISYSGDAPPQTGSVLLPTEAANTPYLFSLHSMSGELQIADIGATGNVGSFTTLSGTAGLGIKSVELLEGGATPTLVASCYDGQMIGVFTVDGSNALVPKDAPIVPDAFGGYPATDLSVHTVGGQTYIVAISAQANMIASFALNESGALEEVDHRGAADGFGINSPTSLATLSVAGRDYVLMSSHGTSSISVLELENNGQLTLRDQVNDNAATYFNDILEVETLVVGQHAFVALAGSDGGVTLLQMLSGGILSKVATYSNPGTDTFGKITMLELFAEGDTLVILTGSEGSDEFGAFSFDTSTLGVISEGLVAATDQDDTVLSNESTSFLTGGGGSDTFILRDTRKTVEITDYEHGVDQIDLSHWPRAHSLSALEFVPLVDGIQISDAYNTLIIRSHDGSPLAESDFTNGSFFELWRIPVTEQTGENEGPDASSGLFRINGADDADTLNGTGGGDLLLGQGGNDILNGFDGDDLIFGSTGADTLTGGQGQDTFVFVGTAPEGDTVTDYEEAAVDLLTGELTGDVIFIQNETNFGLQVSGADIHLAANTVLGGASGNLMVAYLSGTSDIETWSKAALSGMGPAVASLVATLFDLDDDEAFEQIEISFDASGNTTSLHTTNDNATQEITTFDAADEHLWARQVEQLDTQGQRTALNQVFDNGEAVEISYDPDNTRGWDSFTQQFDESTSLREQFVVYDDSTSRRLINDTQATEVWQQIIEDRNTDGVLDDKRVIYDQGTELRTILDVNDTNTWDTVEEFRDAEGALYDKRFNYDNGTSQRLVFDTEGTEVWDLIVELRDDAGTLYDKRTNYDDGTQLRLILDPNNAASWDTIRELSNAQGDLYDKLTTGDTGASTRVILDTDDSANWSMIVENRNPDGDLFKKTTTYDTSNYQLLLIDVDGTESWEVHARVYDSNDVLLSESFD